MKFRKHTLKSRVIAAIAVAILLAKMANPIFAQYGVYVPRFVGAAALGLIVLSQNLMIEYEVPNLPRSAPKIFNLFNFFIAFAIALYLAFMSAYMDVFPIPLTPIQVLASGIAMIVGTSISTSLAVWSYERLLRKHGICPPE